MSRNSLLRYLPAAAAVVGVVVISAPAFAHHAFQAEFDANKFITVTGVVTKVEWTNPHAWLHVNVTDASGAATVWGFELGSPNGLMRRGWTRNSVKAGDTITVAGYQAKDGSKLASARSVSLADGRKMFAGPAEENGPTQ